MSSYSLVKTSVASNSSSPMGLTKREKIVEFHKEQCCIKTNFMIKEIKGFEFTQVYLPC